MSPRERWSLAAMKTRYVRNWRSSFFWDTYSPHADGNHDERAVRCAATLLLTMSPPALLPYSVWTIARNEQLQGLLSAVQSITLETFYLTISVILCGQVHFQIKCSFHAAAFIYRKTCTQEYVRRNNYYITYNHNHKSSEIIFMRRLWTFKSFFFEKFCFLITFIFDCRFSGLRPVKTRDPIFYTRLLKRRNLVQRSAFWGIATTTFNFTIKTPKIAPE